jgi:hypothetical protein
LCFEIVEREEYGGNGKVLLITIRTIPVQTSLKLTIQDYQPLQID